MNRLKVLCGLVILLFIFSSCEKTDEAKITVTNIYPSEARVGESVIVSGSGFSNLKRDSGEMIRVYFEGVEVWGVYQNDTSIIAWVPNGVQPGPICVHHEGAEICSPIPFTVIAGNPEYNSYMRLLDHPGSPTAAASVQAGKNIYVGHINWWKYDIQKNTWTPSAPAPTDKVARATSFTINGKGYLFGGMTTTGPLSNRLQVFDESTSAWSFAAALPANGRADAAVFVINNKAYIAGGNDNVNNPSLNTVGKELWEYDPASNGWTRKADLLFPVNDWEFGYYAIRLGNLGYLPGTQEYNPATNSWRPINSNGSWPKYLYTISANGFEMAYVLGGKYGSGPGSTGNNYVYRVTLNFDRSQLLWEVYKGLPTGGYTTMMMGAAHVFNNELYYGLGSTDPYFVNESKTWWRYRP